MPSDSLLQTPKRHIAKWPFWLGDVLLVGTGIALAFSQGGALSPMAMAWVVFSVACGAVIACAPYAIEYAMNAKHGGGDWAEVRNKVIKLEFRLAEMELNGGGAPESARLAQSRYADYEDDADLGVGEVIKQPKIEAPAKLPEATQLNFGPTGAALIGSAAKKSEESPEAETPKAHPKPSFKISKAPRQDDEDAMLDEAPDEDLPTSLDDIGPAEKRDPTHLRKALEQARKEAGSSAVSRMIRGGKR